MIECRNGKEFRAIFRNTVGKGWNWRNDLRPWLAQMLDGARFGDPAFDWSRDAARELGREFLIEASTW